MPFPSTNHELNALLLKHLIEGASDHAIFLVEPDGTIATWNVGVERLLGYSEAEFLELPFRAIFTEEDCDAGADATELASAAAGGSTEDERWHRRKDGTIFWASGVLSAVYHDGSQLNGFVKIMRDQTAKKQFNDRLLQQTKALAETNRELRSFAGVVSHDLSAPLQTVYGFANLLDQEWSDGASLDAADRDSLRCIIDSTERMLGLVGRLLEYSSSTDRSLKLETVDLNEIVSEVNLDLRTLLIRTHGSIDAHGLPTVRCDRLLVRRVVQNLIENALKYAAPGRPPFVRVRSTRGDGETLVSIEDNGIGIAVADHPQLFTLFRRIDTGTSSPGWGIGLATCRKLVERWGGMLHLSSTPGAGSTFSFSVPDRVDTQRTAEPAVTSSAAANRTAPPHANGASASLQHELPSSH